MSAETKHTPGEWRIRGESDGDGNYTLMVGVFGGAVPPFAATLPRALTEAGGCDPFIENEFRANARLIRAAPELLKALERLVQSGLVATGGYVSDELVLARAALAKAKESK